MKHFTLVGALLATALLASPALADFEVTGTFRYRDRPFTFNSGFTAGTPTLPIRQAVVQVVNNANGAILASGVTDDTGFAAIQVTGSGTLDVVVRCQSRSKTFGGNRVRVTDTSDTLYSVSSSVFTGWDLGTDLAVGTITSEKIFSGSFQANPFNMLDMGVSAVEYLLSLGAPNPSNDIVVRWPGGGGSFASGFTATMGDDDGYDDIVILHEVGHVVHNMYSNSSNPGGFHTFGDSDQDPRLSYAEGWATFFAGATRQFKNTFDPAYYMDASGTASGGIQLRARLENATPFTGSSAGEANEVVIACVLWDVVDTTATNDGNATDDDTLDGSVTFTGGINGDQMQWNTFVGPVKTASNLTIRNHWNAFFGPTDFGHYDRLRDVFSAFEIRNFLDAEEPNNTAATATLVAGDGSWLPIKTLYYSANPTPAPGDTDADFYSIVLAAGDTFEVETRYPNNASDARTYVDPFITVRRPNGTTLASNDTGFSLPDRNAFLGSLTANVAGTWTVAVTSQHTYRKTGSYQVRIARTGFGVTNVTPPTFPALSPTTQALVINGFGLSNVTTITLDGVLLTPLFLGQGNYIVVNDGLINVVKVPLLPHVGTVDLVLQNGATSVTTPLVVTEVSPPLLKTTTAFTNQIAGIDLSAAARVADWMWVSASTFNTPTVFPGLTTLDIGNNGALLVTAWKPFIGFPGHASRHFGPLDELAGLTIFWQGFVLEFANGYNPPWPTTNVVGTFIAF